MRLGMHFKWGRNGNKNQSHVAQSARAHILSKIPPNTQTNESQTQKGETKTAKIKRKSLFGEMWVGETTIETIINYTHSRTRRQDKQEQKQLQKNRNRKMGKRAEDEQRKRNENTHKIAIYIKSICTHMYKHAHIHTHTHAYFCQIKFIHTHNETRSLFLALFPENAEG